MDISFKKDYKENIFSYLYVSGHQGVVALEKKYVEIGKAAAQSSLSQRGLGFYLAFASFLTAHLQKYVLIRYSPFIKNHPSIEEYYSANWKYQVLANDFDGFGVDKGFIEALDEHNIIDDRIHEQKQVLFALKDLKVMKDWPEDTFGDHSSTITIFGLKEDRKTALVVFLQAQDQPSISQFLYSGELLMNISYGKDFGFFDSFLVKSKEDIEHKIAEFKNIVNAGN